MTADEILTALRASSDPTRLPGIARVGIPIDDALGVPVPTIRRIARRAGTDHPLAVQLWATGVHEAHMVAALVADPAAFSARAMTAWAGALDSWDVTDMLADTFAASPLADRMIRTWSRARHGFTKRCAFAMIARLAVSRTDEPDDVFVGFLPLIRSAASDGATR
jgi:3-methyladenine DNA glycosylase AlkD